MTSSRDRVRSALLKRLRLSLSPTIRPTLLPADDVQTVGRHSIPARAKTSRKIISIDALPLLLLVQRRHSAASAYYILDCCQLPEAVILFIARLPSCAVQLMNTLTDSLLRYIEVGNYGNAFACNYCGLVMKEALFSS